jgi:hypothetical protein
MRRMTWLGAALVTGAMGWTGAASAAVMPFSDNFDADTVGATTIPNFTSGGAAIYSIVEQSPGDNALQAVSSVSSGSQGISLTNASGNPITLSTDARLVNLVNGGAGAAANFGFGLFGNSANFSAGTEYRLLLNTIGNAGTLFIVRNGTNATTGVVSGSPVTVANGTDYSLTATVTPTTVAGNAALAFHATATDGTHTSVYDYTDASPLTGTFFGYRTATAATGTSETVQYDNFSATLAPEPGSLALIAFAGVLLPARRRRRRAD